MPSATRSTNDWAVANFARRTARTVFPDQWSFMLGEVALYSFVTLLLFGSRGLRVFFTGARNYELTDLPKDVCDE